MWSTEPRGHNLMENTLSLLADSAPPYPARTTQKLLAEFSSGRLDAIFDRLELTGLCYLAPFVCKISSTLLTFVRGGSHLLHTDSRPATCLPLPVLGPGPGGGGIKGAVRSTCWAPCHLASPTCGGPHRLMQPASSCRDEHRSRGAPPPSAKAWTCRHHCE
jgi:hypothetical protein